MRKWICLLPLFFFSNIFLSAQNMLYDLPWGYPRQKWLLWVEPLHSGKPMHRLRLC